MMTSLNDIRIIERYLKGKLDPEESLLFQTRLLTDPLLKLNIYAQQKVHSILLLYHRNKLREEVEAVHQQLFAGPRKANFKRNIFQLFKH